MKCIKALIMLILFFPVLLSSQSSAKQIGDRYISDNVKLLNLSQTDISTMQVSDIYTTKHNGVTHIYYQQNRNGIPVYNSILNLNISKTNKIVFHANTFIKNLDDKINTSKANITAEFAVNQLAQKIGVKTEAPLTLLKTQNNSLTFKKTAYSKSDIIVKPMYFKYGHDDVRLVWDVTLDILNKADIWNSKIDAVTGNVISHENLTIYCRHEKDQYHNHNASCRNQQHLENEEKAVTSNAAMLTGDSYRVYPFPIESPIYGTHQLITDPFIPQASPFGWHDIDAVDGDEYVITRGNNVHAFQNQNASGFSQNDEPVGGTLGNNTLTFDFPHLQDQEPVASIQADIVNLFYANNMLHDITYLLGFDENAGNFQLNNYGNGGQGNDYVNAYALDGTLINNATDPLNNAYFSTPSDGFSGTMGMFRWQLPEAGLFSINEPSELIDSYVNGTAADGWGFPSTYDNVNITAEVVQAFDSNNQSSNNVCGDVINEDEVNGKIALVFRGLCEFGEKALNVQNAGAVAAIICNVPGAGTNPSSDGNDPIAMGAGVDGPQVTIPTLSLGYDDCNRLIASINQGVNVIATIMPQESDGPEQYSAGFDNGIIAHEFAHGISTRLTAGPSINDCLRNDEQMGEGWSDFFALVTTVEPGDQGTDSRGIGNYVDGLDVDGKGIRRFPYSTDKNINNQTMRDIKATTTPHPLGEIWTATLWDIYWAYVDIYGWKAEWTDTESGNFKAVQLVIDGMKMQGCNPGFIRGRDAILAAEMVNTNGENQCLLWDIFASRGMGFFADGGDEDNRNDNMENFDPLPECQKTLKIYKDIPQVLMIDEDIEVELIVANHKDETVDAVVSDLIPNGMSYVNGSATKTETLSNGQIFFNLDNFESGQWDTIRYKIRNDNTINSQILFSNTVDTNAEVNEWEREFDGSQTDIFVLNSNTLFPTYSGTNSWFVPEVDEDGNASIRFDNITVVGEVPVLRIWHRINTEFTRNGGFIEISNDNVLWTDVADLFIRNGYECPIQFTTFAIPGLQGFSGRSGPNDYVDSYIDLSSFEGQTISLKFRFGTNIGTEIGAVAGDENFPADAGWFIDDIDLIDLVANDTEACISTATDQACTVSPILLDPQMISSVQENSIAGLSMHVFPNPASKLVTIDIISEQSFDGQISILSMEGKQIITENHTISLNQNIIRLNTSTLAPGFYILQLISESGIVSQKVIIQ